MAAAISEASWNPALMPNAASEATDFTLADPTHMDSNASSKFYSRSSQPMETDLLEQDETSSEDEGEDAESADMSVEAAKEDNSQHPELTTLRNALTTSLASPGGVEMDESPVHNGIPKDEFTSEEKAGFPSTGPFDESTPSLSLANAAFDEEDDVVDPEWQPQPTGPDPFKLMAKSDRTNSFPQVPPSHRRVASVPLNEAEEIMNEEAAGFFDDDAPADDFFSKRSPEMEEAEESPEARFEEGVPLIQSEYDAPSSVPPKADFTADTLSFLDDDNAEDDFFAQANKLTPENGDPTFPVLARKSTMQVMESTVRHQLDEQDVLLEEDEPESPEENDLAAKWGAALDEDDLLEDDDSLLDDDDDDRLLNDSDEQPSRPAPIPNSTSQPPATDASRRGSSSRYVPTSVNVNAAPQQPSNPYAPSVPQFTDLSQASYHQTHAPQPPMSTFAPTPQQKPTQSKAQSFADQAKGGYQSPYDLPMEVVKPRKRVSMQHLNREHSESAAQQMPPPPPRSSSWNSVPPLANQPSKPSPPEFSPVGQGAKVAFFEDLPISRPKQAPRSTTASPALPSSPYMYSPTSGPSQLSPPSTVTQQPPRDGLVAPQRTGPYAPLPSNTMSVPPPGTSRYSPAPPAPNSAPLPPVAQSRYSPAPPARPQGAYAAAPVNGLPQPSPPFTHHPRTSSPLAHFEYSQEPVSSFAPSHTNSSDRPGSSSGYESRLKPSPLPPTREVEEEDEESLNDDGKRYMPSSTKYGQLGSGPPPPSAARYAMSPPKRTPSNYTPSPATNVMKTPAFVPPPRSQTQSPGAALNGPRREIISPEPFVRPASVEPPSIAESSPPARSSMQGPRVSHSRALSKGLTMAAPTDGREQDPLQRWKGCPIFVWGVGGTIVTSFPKSIPMYGINAVPSIVRSPGEVKIGSIKEVAPLEERLNNFPGPLPFKGKSKKKDVITWLTSGIDNLEKTSAQTIHSVGVSHEDKREEERILLWKILRIFIENDGLLEGNAVVEKAVREVISPVVEDAPGTSFYATGADLSALPQLSSVIVTADPIDPTAVGELRNHLLQGEREKAVWEAVDKRLWAHAMLISNTVSRDLYKKVAQEFVQKEVRVVGENNESLAALYEIFAGNFEESIDELVPPSARAGFQMVSTTTTAGPAKGALDGLDKWRETLGLILSNRSIDDSQGLLALGKLLSGYGRAEAAHICYLFARPLAVFGGADDPLSSMVLVGSDHLRQPYDFDKELESVILSEVYEYGLSLSSASNVATASPHLAIYKLRHAVILAEQGQRDKALQYCEALATAVTSQTRRSPYHHGLFANALDDLSKRLKQSPKDESSSWISKPSIDKVSGSVWASFHKFVAGDENEDAVAGINAGSGNDVGPFARIAGGTPTISRSPSNSDLYGSYGNIPKANNYLQPSLMSKTGSRYAPGPSYASPTGNEMPAFQPHDSQPQYGSYEPQRQLSEIRPTSSASNFLNNPYSPVQSRNVSGSSYMPVGQIDPSTPVSETTPHLLGDSPQSVNTNDAQHLPNLSNPPAQSFDSGNYGYTPPASSYEPPSSSYEPLSYEPTTMNDEPNSPIDTKPKKKSFMDDDNDDMPEVRGEKSKAEKDREANDAFRKAAEADAKRDAEQATVKKGWLGGWFGGAKKEVAETPQANKPIRAKLGEASSFVYDPDLKRWVNKKDGADSVPTPSATPPPPRATNSPRRAASGPPGGIPGGMTGPTSAPPHQGGMPPMRSASSSFTDPAAHRYTQSDGPSELTPSSLAAPPMLRTFSSASAGGASSGPPSRPGTSMSNASSIDDLLGPPMARKGAKKPKKGRGYIDVMDKNAN